MYSKRLSYSNFGHWRNSKRKNVLNENVFHAIVNDFIAILIFVYGEMSYWRVLRHKQCSTVIAIGRSHVTDKVYINQLSTSDLNRVLVSMFWSFLYLLSFSLMSHELTK